MTDNLTRRGGPWPADQPPAPLIDPVDLIRATVTVHTIDCALDPCTCGGAARPIPGQTAHMDVPALPGEQIATFDGDPA